MSAFYLTADRAALLKAVTAAARAVERRTTIPILSNVRIAVSDGKVAVTGTNLEIEVRAEAEAQGQGSTCVPAQRLRDMLRAMVTTDTVTMRGDGDGKVTLIGGDAEVTFMTLPASDFPELRVGDQTWSVALPDGVTAFVIGGAADVMSTEETRYYLNGVCIEIDDGVFRGTATDGHRLVSRSTNLEGCATRVSNTIVPRDAVKLILPQVGKGEAVLNGYGTNPGVVELLTGDVRIRAKAVDGTYPDWRRVVPKDVGTLLEIRVADLRRSLALARANSDSHGRAVKLASAEDGIKLSSSNPDYGSVSAKLHCSNLVPFTDFGVNALYLDKMARAMERLGSRTLRLEVLRSGDPLRIMPDPAIVGTLAVLMPMRV